jgi:curli biogenesis system outer membrane secretion channel CsgG
MTTSECSLDIDHLQNTGRFDQHNRANLKKDKSNEEVSTPLQHIRHDISTQKG